MDERLFYIVKTMIKHDFIITSPDPWDHSTWRRRHHVAWNRAKNHTVLFVAH